VQEFLEEEGIAYVSKPISLYKSSPLKEELKRLGGKTQVPFLVDPDRNVKMYESEDIIAYVREHYSRRNP
jgi:glutathione S-transferase